MTDVTIRFDGVKFRRDIKLNWYDVEREFSQWLKEEFNCVDYFVDINKFNTTNNAQYANVINVKTGEVERQFVISYNSVVAVVCKTQCLYAGFYSQTTVKHMIRFFKDYCKFDFSYNDLAKCNETKDENWKELS